MSGRILYKVESMIWWLIALTVIGRLALDLFLVVWYVIQEWGILHAFIDGAVLYKIGEAAILVPFLLLMVWFRAWSPERSEQYVTSVRWLMWGGGLLTLIAAFDLFQRVMWAWWTIALTLFALVLPPIMRFLARKQAVWRGRILATVVIILLLFHYAVSFALTGYFIVPFPGPHVYSADTEEGRWQQDLMFMAENIPRLHRNAFHTVDKDCFEAEVARLYEAIPDLDDYQIKAGFHRIAAMIGDGHTGIMSWTGPNSGRLPLRFYWLSDGLFVTAVTEERRTILGGKVLSMGGISADSAFHAVCTLLPYESDSYLLHHSVRYLTDVDFIRGLGIADDSGYVALAVEDRTGDTLLATIAPRSQVDRGEWMRLPETPPSYKSHEGEEYWSAFFDDSTIAYLKYNSFTNPVEFPEFTDEFFAEIERLSVEYVVVDFRENGGGYSPCFDTFYEKILSHDNINRTGHLYHLINRRTYSSASLYTGILKRDTKVLVAGEMMGGGLNHYGDMRMFRLPNSGIQVSYSTKYFELWPDTLPPFALDIEIPLSSKDYLGGHDPVLDSILQLIRLEIGKEQAH